MKKHKNIKEWFVANKQRIILPLLALFWNEIAYYGARILSAGRYHYDMTTALDNSIPIIPWTITIYWGCFLFWAAVFTYVSSLPLKNACRLIFAHFLGIFICFVTFLILPTTNVRPNLQENDIWSFCMRLLYAVDAPDNLFPSIHCFSSWLCWVAVRREKSCPWWVRWGTLLFAAAICISTMTTKQHVFADVIAGILIAEVIYPAASVPALLDKYVGIIKKFFKL